MIPQSAKGGAYTRSKGRRKNVFILGKIYSLQADEVALIPLVLAVKQITGFLDGAAPLQQGRYISSATKTCVPSRL